MNKAVKNRIYEGFLPQDASGDGKAAAWLRRFLHTYRGLPDIIYVMFAVKIVNAMGNFVFPFLALFLKNRLAIDAKTAGLLLTIAALSFAPGSILGGKLSDHYGRKKVFAFFQLASVLLFIPCAFLGKSMLVPVLLILSSFFNGGSQPPLSAMANDVTDDRNRSRAFSLLYLGNNIGFAFGSMIAGFLFSFHTSWLFLGNFVTGALAVLLLMKKVRETKPKGTVEPLQGHLSTKEKAEKSGMVTALLNRPQLLMFGVLSAVYSFVYAQFPFCGSMQVGPEQYGVLMSLNGFVVIAMTTIIINLTHRLKPLLNIAIAGIFFAIGLGMLYFVTAFPLLVLSTIIWTIGEILNTTNAAVHIANNTPSTHRGRFNAAIQILTGSGFALGPTLMGLYIYGKELKSAWALVFAVSAAAAFLNLLLYLYENKKNAHHAA